MFSALLSAPLRFEKWEGLFLFEDTWELEFTVFCSLVNEFSQNAKVSPLALLAMKGLQSYLLDEQYRMCPACSSFPRKQSYDDKDLKDSAMIKKDGIHRQAMRQL